MLKASGADRLLVASGGVREACAHAVLRGAAPVRDPRLAGLRARFPDRRRATSARSRALELFERRALPLGPEWRHGVAAAAWIASTHHDPERLLTRPLAGHLQAEVLAATAALLDPLPRGRHETFIDLGTCRRSRWLPRWRS